MVLSTAMGMNLTDGSGELNQGPLHAQLPVQDSGAVPSMAPGPESGSTLAPVPESERIAAMDTLRGFALFGILVVNMQFFSLPFMRALHDPSLGEAPASSQLAWAITKVFFEFKFISIFSLLFGMGLVLQMNRAEASGRPFVSLYIRRLAVLFAIGAVHGLALWYGDILLVYALLGIGLLLCRNLSPRTLLISAGALVLLAAFLFQVVTAAEVLLGEAARARGQAADSSGEGTEADSPRGLSAIMASEGDPSNPAWVEGEIAAYRDGPASHAFVFRLVSFLYCSLVGVLVYGWRVLGLFFAGAALLKLGFFGADRRDWQRRLAVIGIAVGLPMELSSVAITYALDYKLRLPSLLAVFLHDFGSLALCLGYLGTVTLIVTSGAFASIAHLLARVGRLALTNYLAQTVVATFLMYWWGLGMFGGVSRPMQLVLALAIYLGLAAASVIWLERFTIGPAEWVWRSLTYGRRQPIRRVAPQPPPATT